MHVISIQSQVIYGHVGNSASVFPMQVAGLDVVAVPTVLLSNHPRYPTMHGKVVEAELLAGLLQGVEERGLVDSASVILSGYLGSVENGDVIAEFVERARKRNPGLIYICDPVMGDDDLGLFVKPDLLEVLQKRLVPLADIITPNRYELELLTDTEVRSVEGLDLAMRRLNEPCTIAAAITGCVLNDTPRDAVETVVWQRGVIWRTSITRLPIRPCGTGDLYTALLITRLCNGEGLAKASDGATNEIFAVLQRTQAEATEEMRIVGFPFSTRIDFSRERTGFPDLQTENIST